MADDEDAGPALHEEARDARGRVAELLLGAVTLSTLCGLSTNIGSALVGQFLTPGESAIATGVLALLGIVVLVVLVPRISTTIKEFHEDIELVIPFQVGPEDVSILRIKGYDTLTERANAALAARPPDERKRLAETLRGGRSGDDVAGRRAVTALVLELTQFLLMVELAQGSRRLLGKDALYHKAREIYLQQPRIDTREWRALAGPATGNRFFEKARQGIPEKVPLPPNVRVTLPEVAPRIFKPRRRRMDRPEFLPLITISSGRDSAIKVTALAEFSEHGFPAPNKPHAGLTARCVLRNARDPRLRDLAKEEEDTSQLLTANGQARTPHDESVPDPVAHYATLHRQLWGGATHPRLVRVFVRLDGGFRIRLLNSERRQRGLYAWGAAISRHLAQLDIEVWLAQLKEEGQHVPRRTF